MIGPVVSTGMWKNRLKKRFASGINKEEWTHQKQWFPSNFPLVGAQPFSWYNSLDT
jgi:hypothetical protein